jgi:nucleotide-binding universal stress UspA family protein
MKISQAIKMALSSIFYNKLRSFLTMLGIIIGVMSVVLLVSIVQGATGSITESLNSLGGDLLTVTITNNKAKLNTSNLNEITELDKVKMKSQDERISGEFLLQEGDPSEMIVQTAQKRNSGLILMGSHGHSGLKRLLMGSVTERVIGRAPCPIIVART